MKKWLRSVAFVAVCCLLCVCAFGCSFEADKEPEKTPEQIAAEEAEKAAILKRVEQIQDQLKANAELKTYINNVALYEELIELQPKTLEWYVGLADTYLELKLLTKYRKTGERLIEEFPEKAEGYLILMRFYDEKDAAKNVIKTFVNAPDSIQANAEIRAIYEKHEWTHRLRGATFDEIGLFSGERYVVNKKGLYGYRKRDIYNGISTVYTVARPFIEGYAAVLRDGEWYLINKSGYRALATRLKLEDLYSLSEGYAVGKVNGKYGYLDTAFQQYHFEYEDATSFFNGVAAVKKDGKWALIDKEFTLLTEFVYDDVVRDEANICSRADAVIVRYDGAYRLLDIETKKLADVSFADAKPFYSEYAAVKKDGAWGFVDAKGKTVIDFEYDDANSCAAEVAAVKKDGYWGCVSIDGDDVLPFEYEDAHSTSPYGLIVVQTSKGYYQFVQYYKFDVLYGTGIEW